MYRLRNRLNRHGLIPWSLVTVWIAAGAAGATTFTVTRTDDPIPDACLPTDCSLREAVIEANGMAGADTIELPAGTYTLAIPPPTGNDELSGDLDLLDEVTLSGAGSLATIVDGGGLDRVFDIGIGVGPVEITDLAIQNGSSSSGGGIRNSGVLEVRRCVVLDNTVVNSGGGINNAQNADLLVEDCEISGNTGTGVGSGGGGVFNNGSVLIRRSMIAGNTAASGGGLLNNDLAVEMTIEHSTISGNFAVSDFRFTGGGGIINYGNLTVHHSTISDNTATLSDGGGLNVFFGNASLWNVTFSGNSAASEGGAIYNGWFVYLVNGTIVDNTAADTGGVFTSSGLPRETAVATSIVADNPGGNCSGNVSSDYPNHNLDSGSTCGFAGPGDLSNTDPMLDSLADNGGRTQTHALLAGSPAIDGGDPVNGCLIAIGLPPTDQRGFPRPVDGDDNGAAVCDIGAFEFGAEDIFADGFESGDTSSWSASLP